MKAKRFILGIISLFSCYSIIAKNTDDISYKISGKVLDSSDNLAVELATVYLSAQDGSIITGTTSDAEGAFLLLAPKSTAQLTVQMVGYKTYSQTISIDKDINIGNILLELDQQMLQSATVTSRVNMLEVKVDKIVMNVSQSAFSSGSNALELLKKAPGVTIDKDGNIQLNGKSVSIWIDGRPSQLNGKSLEALLRSTNSESIEKFELMANPSAKYDASGQGGIIDIKTKRNFLQGLNGSVGLGGGSMYFKDLERLPYQQSAWMNLSYRTDKTHSFLNVYEGRYDTPVKVINDFYAMNSPLAMDQKGYSYMNTIFNAYNIKIGTDWFIDDKNTVGIIYNVPGSFMDGFADNSQTQTFDSNGLIAHTSTFIENTSKALQQNVNLNYTHVFDPNKSQEITANIDYYNNSSKDISTQIDTNYAITPVFKPESISRQMMDTRSIYDIYSAKADYQSVILGLFMLESGAKWALSKTDNKSIESITLQPDKNEAFKYAEHIGAAYASLSGALSPKLTFKLGLRAEYTYSHGDWISSDLQTQRCYLDVFPTAFVGFRPNDKWMLSTSYTRRIDRPSYSHLNPAKFYVDANTFLIGNPDILPQYSDNLSLNTMYGSHLSMSLSYNHTSNLINQIPGIDAQGIRYMTWGNMGSQDVFSASANIAALPLGKWVNWTFSTSGNYISSSIPEMAENRRSLYAFAYTNFSVLFPNDWKMDLDAFATTPMVIGYYYIYPMFSSNVGVKKSFLDNKLTLSIKLNDIFRSSANSIKILETPNTKGMENVVQQLLCNQKLLIDISYSFGSNKKALKYRKVGGLEEMNRVSSGSNSIGGGISK